MTASFGVLGYYGVEIYRMAPPIPEQVINEEGEVIFTKEDIQEGQRVWQSIGGQELGTVWGHGSYIAPDWNADWIHKEAVFILNEWGQSISGANFEALNSQEQASLQAKLQDEIRNNTYDKEKSTILISKVRERAIKSNVDYYTRLFSDDKELTSTRKRYAMKENTLSDKKKIYQLNAFFFWTSWACTTERPSNDITYTNNWPAEKLVGNKPTGALLLWTGVSIIMLLLGIGILAFYYARNEEDEIDRDHLPKNDPLKGDNPTSSMKATLKYFWTCQSSFWFRSSSGWLRPIMGWRGKDSTVSP